MAKKSIKVEVNNFVQGLITEASPLNFPPNATVDESNFVLNRDGTRNRRLGMDLDNAFAYIPSSMSVQDMEKNPVAPFKWTNVAGNSALNFLAVQSGLQLMIFDLGVDNLSADGLIGNLSLGTVGFTNVTPFSYASVDGKLIVAGGSYNIAIISYKDGLFDTVTKPLLVRDVWGLQVKEDNRYETDNQFRGITASPHSSHRYNLYNQSWGIPRKTPFNVFEDPVSVYSTLGKYPSNSETVWPGMQFKPVAAGNPPEELMYVELYEQAFGSDVKAAKGHYIIDLLRRGASRSNNILRAVEKHPELFMKGIATPADITPGGATAVCEFAGRVFYAGFSGDVIDGDSRSPSLSNHILFSQLVKSTNDLLKCYQDGDPTSRENNDLIDTDGGFIRLSGAEGIVGMVNLGSVLIVFAKNGVWVVSGGSDYGFSATNYKAERVSNFGVIGRNSIVQDGARALYWSEDGIYAIVKDQFGSYSSENITQKTIQKLYDAIPSVSKSNAMGIFDPIGKKLRWVYHTGERFSPESESKELILDLTLGAFYQFTLGRIDVNPIEVMAPFTSVPFVVRTTQATVKSFDNIVLSNSESVIVPYEFQDSVLQTTRYLIVRYLFGLPYLTFGLYNNTSFRDWESVDGAGVDAAAYLVTGAVTAGDSSVAKQMPYLTLHFNRTESGVDTLLEPQNQSACLVQSQWDWSNSANSNKWSSKFQGYRQRKAYLPEGADDVYDTGFQLVTTKNKIRGRGRAFALRMETEPAKDCQIVGWSIALNGNPVT